MSETTKRWWMTWEMSEGLKRTWILWKIKKWGAGDLGKHRHVVPLGTTWRRMAQNHLYLILYKIWHSLCCLLVQYRPCDTKNGWQDRFLAYIVGVSGSFLTQIAPKLNSHHYLSTVMRGSSKSSRPYNAPNSSTIARAHECKSLAC